MLKPIHIFIFILALFLNACGSTPVHVVPINETVYSLGKKHGCATAQGSYTKESHTFRTSYSYQEGWFAGRRSCNK